MSIELTVLGIVTLFKAVHDLNAETPIVVTLLGIVILVNEMQFKNAELPILTTVYVTLLIVNDDKNEPFAGGGNRIIPSY